MRYLIIVASLVGLMLTVGCSPHTKDTFHNGTVEVTVDYLSWPDVKICWNFVKDREAGYEYGITATAKYAPFIWGIDNSGCIQTPLGGGYADDRDVSVEVRKYKQHASGRIDQNNYHPDKKFFYLPERPVTN